MAGTVCYIKLNQNVEVMSEDVYMKDAGSVYCADKTVAAKVKSMRIHRFQEKDCKRCVISVLKITEMIEQMCPQVTVESVGESDVVAEWVKVNKHKGTAQLFKIILVAIISFFGTAFTIMAYHNDIGIADVFAQIHRLVMGSDPEGVSALEVAYSAGLSIGIIVFFNHVGGRRLTKDPTPIEVEMRKYETDVNTALVDTAEREGKIIDVE